MKVFGKFFDAEAADYKKEVAAKVPNYNWFLEMAGDEVLDFNMTNNIAEIDRDADRWYAFATRQTKELAEKGPDVSPDLADAGGVGVKNDDAESYEALKKLVEEVKKSKGSSEVTEVLPMGKNFNFVLPMQLVN